jgi:preprotein translocase subunit SecA
MFENLKAQIQHYIVDQLMRLTKNGITITIKAPAPPKRKNQRALRTNADVIAQASGQAKTDERDLPRITSRRQGTPGRQNSQRAISHSAPRSFGRIGRNDPCPCGSGKKYKKCHGA